MGSRRDALSLEEAQRRILAHALPLSAERMPLAEVLGLRIAEAVCASEPIPAFTRSGVDGYAVSARDLASASPHSPVLLTLISQGTSEDGPGRLGHRETMRIGTGGQLPEGADTVVMQEAVTLRHSEGDLRQVVFLRPEPIGWHVTAAGAEAAAGSVLLAEHTRIGAGQVAVLASLGIARPRVYRKPRIAIVTVGEDIVPIESTPGHGQVRNGNQAMLRAQVESAGGFVVHTEHVPDERAQAEQAMRRSLDQADALLVSGGISVGDTDVMGGLFRDAGPDLLFGKLAIRPGSASSAIVAGGKLAIGLSGNPGACFAGFELLARPAIDRMGGGSGRLRQVRARLAEGYIKRSVFPRFLRGIVWMEDGTLAACPCVENSSSGLVSIAEANALLAIHPSGQDTVAGATIDVLLLPGWEEIAWHRGLP